MPSAVAHPRRWRCRCTTSRGIGRATRRPRCSATSRAWTTSAGLDMAKDRSGSPAPVRPATCTRRVRARLRPQRLHRLNPARDSRRGRTGDQRTGHQRVVHAGGATQVLLHLCRDRLTIAVRDGTDVPPRLRAGHLKSYLASSRGPSMAASPVELDRAPGGRDPRAGWRQMAVDIRTCRALRAAGSGAELADNAPRPTDFGTGLRCRQSSGSASAVAFDAWSAGASCAAKQHQDVSVADGGARQDGMGRLGLVAEAPSHVRAGARP